MNVILLQSNHHNYNVFTHYNLYSCSHHPDDGRMSGRNMSVVHTFIHTLRCICWSCI